MYNYLQVGRIINTFGIKGELKIIPLTDSVERFSQLDYVFIEDEKMDKKLTIQKFRVHKNILIIKFREINTIEEAEKYKNKYIVIERDRANKLPEGSYFICDIIGLDVYSNDDNFLGKIKDVIKTGSNDVYVCYNKENGKEVLIPAIKQIVKEVNIDKGYMKIEPIEGLIE